MEIDEETKTECLYICSFKRSMLMADKMLLFGKKKKDRDLGVTEINVLEKVIFYFTRTRICL